MVITGRPRAHSASSIKLNQVLQLQQPPGRRQASSSSIIVAAASSSAGGKKLSYSSPELRSMLVGLETTVPQNLNPAHLGSRHRPRRPRRKMGSRVSLVQAGRERGGAPGDGREVRCCSSGGGGGGGGGGGRGACGCGCFCCCCCGDGEEERTRGCCRVHIFLVLMQLLVGAAVMAVSVYMHLFLPVFIMRETPIWAGAPLCAAGILGIYFCATNFTDYSKTTRAFVLKVLCSIFSAVSVFVCVTAAIFIAIHLGRIFTYVTCRQTENDCYCSLSAHHDEDDFLPRIIRYPGIKDCFHIFCEVKIYLLVVGSLCLAGSLFSLWFTFLLWKARYGRFHSGVRLPSVRRSHSSPNL